jgi:hypothetical protein
VDKLILMSVLVFTLVVPAIAARGRSPLRSVRRMVLTLLVLNAVYVLVVAYVYVANFVPEWSP